MVAEPSDGADRNRARGGAGKVLRELHGLLWWDHDGERYCLQDRPVWIDRDGAVWRMRREGDERALDFPSRDEAMAYVVLAFERYGDPAALPLSNSAA